MSKTSNTTNLEQTSVTPGNFTIPCTPPPCPPPCYEPNCVNCPYRAGCRKANGYIITCQPSNVYYTTAPTTPTMTFTVTS